MIGSLRLVGAPFEHRVDRAERYDRCQHEYDAKNKEYEPKRAGSDAAKLQKVEQQSKHHADDSVNI